MNTSGRLNFCHCFLEDRAYSYINLFRNNPKCLQSLLCERKKHFVSKIYKPPCLKSVENLDCIEYIGGIERLEAVVEIVKSVESQEKKKRILEDDVRLSELCKLSSIEEIVKKLESEYNFKDQNLKFCVFRIPKQSFHFTIQQILLDLLLGDGLKGKKQVVSDSQLKAMLLQFFNPEFTRVGIGMFPYLSPNEVEALENKEPVDFQFHLIFAGEYTLKKGSKEKKGGKGKGGTPTTGKRKQNRKPSKLKSRFRPPPIRPDLLEFTFPLELDDNFLFNEKISLEEILTKKKRVRNGMILVNNESKTLDYKQYQSSFNMNRPYYTPEKDFIHKMCVLLRNYFVAFANTINGRLVFGVIDKINFVDCIIIDDLLEERIKKCYDAIMKESILPQYDAKQENLLFISCQSNFKDTKMIILDVVNVKKKFYVFKERTKRGTLYASLQRQTESNIFLDWDTIATNYFGKKPKDWKEPAFSFPKLKKRLYFICGIGNEYSILNKYVEPSYVEDIASIGSMSLSEMIPVSSLVGRLMRYKERCLAILGSCGVGKTSLLYFLAKSFSERFERNECDVAVIFIELKKVKKDVLGYIRDVYGFDLVNDEDFDFSTKKFLFLADGYDEVEDEKLSDLRLEELFQFQSKVVITCRTHFASDEEMFRSEFAFTFQQKPITVKFLYLMQFSNSQMRDYVKKYFLSKEQQKLLDNDAINVVDEYIKDATKIIDTNKSLQQLIMNPLLLNCFLDIFWTRKEKDNFDICTRTNIYDSFFNIFLMIQKSKNKRNIHFAERFKDICYKISLQFYRSGTRTQIEFNYSKKKHLESIREIEKISKEIKSNPFIIRSTEKRISFIHTSFLEFFIAKQIVDEIIRITNSYKLKVGSLKVAVTKEKEDDVSENSETDSDDSDIDSDDSNSESGESCDDKKGGQQFDIVKFVGEVRKSILNHKLLFYCNGIRDFIREMIDEKRKSLNLLKFFEIVLSFKTHENMVKIIEHPLKKARIFCTNAIQILSDIFYFQSKLVFSGVLNDPSFNDDMVKMSSTLKILQSNYYCYLLKMKKKGKTKFLDRGYINYLIASEVEKQLMTNFFSSHNRKERRSDLKSSTPKTPKIERSFYDVFEKENDLSLWKKSRTYDIMEWWNADFNRNIVYSDNIKLLKKIRTPELRFVHAVRGSTISILKKMLRKGNVDPSIYNNYAIKEACKEGNIKVVRLLMDDRRVNPSASENYCLLVACKRNNFKLVKCLLDDKYERIDAKSDPIIKFIVENLGNKYNIKIIELLRVRINKKLSLEELILSFLETDKLSGEQGKKKTMNKETRTHAFVNACKLGYNKIALKLIHDLDVNVGFNRNDALKFVIKNRNMHLLSCFLQSKRFDPSSSKNECLQIATRANNREMVAALLKDERVTPFCFEKKVDPFQHAIGNHFEGLVSQFLAKTTNRALFSYVIKNNFEKIKELNCDDFSSMEFYFLKLAIKKDWRKIVQFVLSKFESKFRSSKKLTFDLARVAVIYGNFDVVKELLSWKEFDPSFKQNSLFHIAVRGKLPIVKLLLGDSRVSPFDIDKHTDGFRMAMFKKKKEMVGEILRNKRICLMDYPDNPKFFLSIIERNQKEAVQLMNSPKVNPYTMECYCFKLAVTLNCLDVVQMFLRLGKIEMCFIEEGFTRECTSRNIAGIKVFLRGVKKLSSTVINECFKNSVNNGHFDVMTILLEDPRVDPACDENFAIRCSSSRGDTISVNRLLKESKVDPSAGNNEALRGAIRIQSSQIVKHLLKDSRVDPTPFVVQFFEESAGSKRFWTTKRKEILNYMVINKAVQGKRDKLIKFRPKINKILGYDLGEMYTCLEKGICTANIKGKKYIVQRWWHCNSCNINGKKGLCLICTYKCHKGHDVSEMKRSPSVFYCDCTTKH